MILIQNKPGAAKESSPLKNLTNFSRTIEIYDVKFHTLVTFGFVEVNENYLT